jgi:hypothetical protein
VSADVSIWPLKVLISPLADTDNGPAGSMVTIASPAPRHTRMARAVKARRIDGVMASSSSSTMPPPQSTISGSRRAQSKLRFIGRPPR